MFQFWETKKPYFHVLYQSKVCEKELMNELKQENENFKICFIDGKKCKNVDNLFHEFSIKLSFPSYFGFNWDAFEECLNDLDWIVADGFLFVIDHCEELLINAKEKFELFCDIMKDAAEAWNMGENCSDNLQRKKPFHILFCCSQRREAYSILNKTRAIGIEIQLTNKQY